MHRIQGQSNEIQNKVWGCGCIGIIVLAVLLTMIAMCGLV